MQNLWKAYTNKVKNNNILKNFEKYLFSFSLQESSKYLKHYKLNNKSSDLPQDGAIVGWGELVVETSDVVTVDVSISFDASFVVEIAEVVENVPDVVANVSDVVVNASDVVVNTSDVVVANASDVVVAKVSEVVANISDVVVANASNVVVANSLDVVEEEPSLTSVGNMVVVSCVPVFEEVSMIDVDPSVIELGTLVVVAIVDVVSATICGLEVGSKFGRAVG